MRAPSACSGTTKPRTMEFARLTATFVPGLKGLAMTPLVLGPPGPMMSTPSSTTWVS